MYNFNIPTYIKKKKIIIIKLEQFNQLGIFYML